MKFCVIGTGGGGRAFATYLASKGNPINLYNRSEARIADIKQKGGIEAQGALNGFFPIDIITQDIELAVKDTDVILVVIPASGHKNIANVIAPYLTNGQIIILNPGRTFGAVEFLNTIEKIRGKIPIFVGEAQTLLFASREMEGNQVNIINIKNSMNFSTYPDENVSLVYDKLKETFPQFTPVDDYLEVTLNNIGMLLHPAISLMNAGMIDHSKEFKFYIDGASPKVCQVLEQIELELSGIFKKLGLKQVKYHKWAEKSYGVSKESIYEAIQNIEPYRSIKAPTFLITRYFTEDVPTGLVPFISLGEFLDVKMPTVKSIVHLSSVLCGVDFIKEGRTLKNLNLTDFIRERMNSIESELSKK